MPSYPPGRQSPAQFPPQGYTTGEWQRSNSCGGVHGVTVATGNTAGTDQFDTVTITGAGTTVTFDAGNYHSAPSSIKVSLAAGVSSVARLIWTAVPGADQQRFARFYYFLTSPVPAATPNILSFGNMPFLRVSATGAIALYDTNGTLKTTMAVPVPLGQWVRIEADYTSIVWGSGCTVAVRMYSGANLETFTPDAGGSFTTTGVALGGTRVTGQANFGPNTVTEANGYTCWYDDVAASNTAPPGPAPPPTGMTSVLGQATPRLAPPGLSNPMAWRVTPSQPALPAVTGTPGPPVYPPGHPVQARSLPQRGGRTASRTGLFAGPGPAVYPPGHPVRARTLPQRGGTAASRTGVFTQTAAASGPPVRPLAGPVQARRLPARGGSAAGHRGVFAGTGPQLRPAPGPVHAAQPLPPHGRLQSHAGTFTAVVTGSGAPLYPLGHPVTAKRLPQRGGRVIRAAGTYAGTGPAAVPLHHPIGPGRQQPPPPARGRSASLHGPYGSTGPPVIPLRRPVRGQPQKPVLTGRAGWRAGVYTAPFIPPFTIGTLTAAGAPSAVLTASGASSALTAAATAQGTLTATTKTTGGPS